MGEEQAIRKLEDVVEIVSFKINIYYFFRLFAQIAFFSVIVLQVVFLLVSM